MIVTNQLQIKWHYHWVTTFKWHYHWVTTFGPQLPTMNVIDHYLQTTSSFWYAASQSTSDFSE